MKRLFVLTTRATHWFIEHGFAEATVEALPQQKQALVQLPAPLQSLPERALKRVFLKNAKRVLLKTL